MHFLTIFSGIFSSLKTLTLLLVFITLSNSSELILGSFNLKGFGSIVLIRHSNGWISSYAHLSKILVKQGDLVKQGQELGLVGNTGRVSRPQLYFEIRDSEKPINPEIYLSS